MGLPTWTWRCGLIARPVSGVEWNIIYHLKKTESSRTDMLTHAGPACHRLYTYQDNLDKPVPEGQTILDFNEAKDDEVAVTSAEPYAYQLHLVPDK